MYGADARVVPWHEGLRTLDLVDYAAADVQPVWGTRARKLGDRWFAPDVDGTFRFEVTPDKVYGYPSNLFIDDRNFNQYSWEGAVAGAESVGAAEPKAKPCSSK